MTISIPARVRQLMYLVWSLSGLVMASIIAYEAAVGDAAPKWAGGVGAVLSVLGTALGFTALAHMSPDPKKSPQAPGPPYASVPPAPSTSAGSSAAPSAAAERQGATP
jgi:hypothetical protein